MIVGRKKGIKYGWSRLNTLNLVNKGVGELDLVEVVKG